MKIHTYNKLRVFHNAYNLHEYFFSFKADVGYVLHYVIIGIVWCASSAKQLTVASLHSRRSTLRFVRHDFVSLTAQCVYVHIYKCVLQSIFYFAIIYNTALMNFHRVISSTMSRDTRSHDNDSGKCQKCIFLYHTESTIHRTCTYIYICI